MSTAYWAASGPSGEAHQIRDALDLCEEISPYTARMPFADTPRRPEELLHDKLTALVDNALDRMIETGNIEPGLLSLIAGANAAIAVLDARQRAKEPA